MRVGNKLAIGVHILSLLATEDAQEQSSEWLAGSIGVNPVIVRNVIGLLRRSGLVYARQGVAGTHLARPLSQITLLDVYQAVETDRDLFSIHTNPNPDCAVGSNISITLTNVFGDAQRAMEEQLGKTSLTDIVAALQTSNR